MIGKTISVTEHAPVGRRTASDPRVTLAGDEGTIPRLPLFHGSAGAWIEQVNASLKGRGVTLKFDRKSMA